MRPGWWFDPPDLTMYPKPALLARLGARGLQSPVHVRRFGFDVLDAKRVGRAPWATVVDLQTVDIKTVDKLGGPTMGKPAAALKPKRAIGGVVARNPDNATRPGVMATLGEKPHEGITSHPHIRTAKTWLPTA